MALGEVMGGKALDLLIAGLHRGGSVIFQKINRLQRIDQSIKGLALENPAVKTALRDFEVVIGTYHGKLTTRLAAFLDELRTSGLIEAMVQNAVINRESPELYTAFANMHNRVMGPESHEQPPKDLFNAMVVSFRTTLGELSKDPANFYLLQTAQKEFGVRLDRIDECLSTLLGNAALKHVSYADLLPILTRISKGLQSSYRNVRIETNRGPREVDINKIYIPPNLHVKRSKGSIGNLSNLSRSILKLAHQHRPSFHFGAAHDLASFSYIELARSFNRIIVLGDPGGGKSTLCQKLCYDMAKNSSLSLQFPDAQRLDADLQRIPIRIVLRKFEQARENEAQLTLIRYMTREIENIAGGDAHDIGQGLNYILENGRAVLAFDGLDEILDTSKRQDYVELVTALCDQFPLCPVLVTSRLVGYEDAPLSQDFEEVILEKLDEDQVEHYIRKFMSVVGGKSKPECETEARRFIDQTSVNAEDLRRNPLLLGLMAWLFLANDDVPSNRPEIYRECSILLFERWDQKRGILADGTSDFDRSQLFITLASEIYGQPKLAAGVTKKWLTDTLQAWFLTIYESKAQAYKAAVAFVKFITGRAWVLSEVGQDTFSFTHQTFLEYFFARHIDDSHDTVATLLRSLKPRIVKHEWNEVAHLALQLKTDRSMRKQEEALQILMAYIVDSKIPKQQVALMQFAARALEYLSPSERSVGLFIETIWDIAVDRARSRVTGGLAAFTLCANAPRERRAYARGKIATILSKKLFDKDDFEASTAALVIARRSRDAERWTAEDSRSRLPKDMSDQLIEASKEKVLILRTSSALHAALAFSWYGDISEEDVRRFGIAPFFNHPVLNGIHDLDGISTLVVYGTRNLSAGDRMNMDILKRGLRAICSGGSLQLPLKRSEFDRRRFPIRVPSELWLDALSQTANDAETTVGVIFARHIVGHLNRVIKTPLAGDRAKKVRGTPLAEEISILQKLVGKVPQAEVVLAIAAGKKDVVID